MRELVACYWQQFWVLSSDPEFRPRRFPSASARYVEFALQICGHGTTRQLSVDDVPDDGRLAMQRTFISPAWYVGNHQFEVGKILIHSSRTYSIMDVVALRVSGQCGSAY